MSKHRVAVLKVVSAAVRHRRRGRVRDEPAASAPPAAPVPGRRPRGPRAALAPTTQPARADAARPCASGSSPCARSSPPAASTPARSRSPGTSSARASPSRRPRPSGASSTPPAWSSPEPRKRPRSSWIRFEAAAPNELWQSDVTHWHLADGTEVEICSWLDDHSRYLLGCTAFGRVAGDDVVATFAAAGEEHGWPAATLTDNGAVYTSRFTGGRNGFEYLLAYLGIRQKNGAPGHPQTQGKIERFHQTLKRWLGQPAGRADPGRAAGPARRLPPRLQRAAAAPGDRADHPGEAYRARPKAHPAGRGARATSGCATTSPTGRASITLRRAGRLHHLGDRRRPRPPAGPGHRRRARGHGRRPRHRRGPLHPPHRAGPRLLAQPTTRPRPMAGVSSDRGDVGLVHVSPMSRLMCRPCRDS